MCTGEDVGKIAEKWVKNGSFPTCRPFGVLQVKGDVPGNMGLVPCLLFRTLRAFEKSVLDKALPVEVPWDVPFLLLRARLRGRT